MRSLGWLVLITQEGLSGWFFLKKTDLIEFNFANKGSWNGLIKMIRRIELTKPKLILSSRKIASIV